MREREKMHTQLKYLGALTAFAMLIASSSAVGAGAAAQQSKQPIAPYGVGVTPAVYLVNFMIMYIASPVDAAKMPAFRAPVPSSLADCLQTYPSGCPYSEFANSFDDQPFKGKANRTKNCALPPDCRTTTELERLAPSVVERPEQINEPLGMERAKRIAREVGIDSSMILTDEQWECTRGIPPWPVDANKQIINACLSALTNSNGNTNIPLSSYGLAITRADFEGRQDDPVFQRGGDVQSLCAPQAPCLQFNDLFGPRQDLRKIAELCGWGPKLTQLEALHSFKRVIYDGYQCQTSAGAGSLDCLVEPECP
jgi:hypothetical protein